MSMSSYQTSTKGSTRPSSFPYPVAAFSFKELLALDLDVNQPIILPEPVTSNRAYCWLTASRDIYTTCLPLLDLLDDLERTSFANFVRRFIQYLQAEGDEFDFGKTPPYHGLFTVGFPKDSIHYDYKNLMYQHCDQNFLSPFFKASSSIRFNFLFSHDEPNAIVDLTLIPSLEVLQEISPPLFSYLETPEANTVTELPAPSSSLTDRSYPQREDTVFRGVLNESACGRMIRDFPWETTSLGPIQTWPPVLKSTIPTMLASTFRKCLYLGTESLMIYNDTFGDYLPNRHMEIGQPSKNAFPDLWPHLQAQCEPVMRGLKFALENDFMPIVSGDMIEEQYHTWVLHPFYDENNIIGVVSQSFDTTASVILSRHLGTLRSVLQKTSGSTSIAGVMDGMEHNDRDIPFSTLFTCEALSTPLDSEQQPLRLILTLQSCLGVMSDMLPIQIPFIKNQDGRWMADLDTDFELHSKHPAQLQEIFDGLGEVLTSGKEHRVSLRRYNSLKRRGWIEPIAPFITFPIIQDSENVRPFVIMILGLNPRRPYNNQSKDFVQLLAGQLAGGLHTVMIMEQEVKAKEELEIRVLRRARELQESETHYRNLVEHFPQSPVGLFNQNLFGEMTAANDMFTELTGYNASTTTQKIIDTVYHEDRQLVQKAWEDLVSLKVEEVCLDFRWSEKSWYKCQARRLIVNGVHKGFIGALTDISLLKELEALRLETIEKKAATSEEHRKQIELLVDITCHELRNPLSAICQHGELLEESSGRLIGILKSMIADNSALSLSQLQGIVKELEENYEGIRAIRTCAQHQSKITDDIVNFSRLEMSLIKLIPLPFSVGDMMQEILRMSEIICNSKKISLRVQKGSCMNELASDWLVADSFRLAQASLNFVTNAIKHSENTRMASIVLHCDIKKQMPRDESTFLVTDFSQCNAQWEKLSDENVWLILSVQDYGRGMSREGMEAIFKHFDQIVHRNDHFNDSRLGLYVCKMIVELHGGFIEVFSSSGNGSTFRLAVPAKLVSGLGSNSTLANNSPLNSLVPSLLRKRSISQSALSDLSTHVSKLRATNDGTRIASKTEIQANNASNVHILVVEDNLVNQKVLVRQLQRNVKFACRVSIANNGKEALKVLTEQMNANPIDIVLMDIEMPVMSGLEAVVQLRAKEQAGEITGRFPVLAVTGNARKGQTSMYQDSGFDGVIIKPYDFAEMLSKIEGFLRLQK